MKPLILTNNPNLASTARVLTHWLSRDAADRLDACVAAPRQGELTQWLAGQGVPHYVTDMPHPNKRWPLPGLWYAWRLAAWAKQQGVDVIHCNEHDVYPFALLLKRLLKLPAVCHVRFRISPEFCQWAFGGDDRRPDALLWTSRQQMEDCAEAVAGVVPRIRQHVLPLGVDVRTMAPGDEDRAAVRRGWGVGDDAVVIGTASALRPIKQIEHFVELVAALARRHERVAGVIAGDAPAGMERYKRQVLDQIAAAGLGGRLMWLGHVDAMDRFMAGVDVFVSTSKYETFGNSVCEAMAAGCGVAGYVGGSVGEVIGDERWVVETGRLDALIGVTDRLVSDAALRDLVGRRNRRRVKEAFDPAAGLRKLMTIYQSILEPRSAMRWAA